MYLLSLCLSSAITRLWPRSCLWVLSVLSPQQTFPLACCRKSTGGSHNTNEGCVSLKCPGELHRLVAVNNVINYTCVWKLCFPSWHIPDLWIIGINKSPTCAPWWWIIFSFLFFFTCIHFLTLTAWWWTPPILNSSVKVTRRVHMSSLLLCNLHFLGEWWVKML